MLDKYHEHEVLDRIWIFIDMINDHVLNHPYIENNKSMQHKIEVAMDLLMEVYQEIGRERGNN